MRVFPEHFDLLVYHSMNWGPRVNKRLIGKKGGWEEKASSAPAFPSLLLHCKQLSHALAAIDLAMPSPPQWTVHLTC